MVLPRSPIWAITACAICISCLAGCASGAGPGEPSAASREAPLRYAGGDAEPATPSSPAEAQAPAEGGGGPSLAVEAAPGEPKEHARAADPRKAPTTLEETWGIQILPLRLSSGGYMLDFRYRVLEPEKAGRILHRKAKPYLIDQASGARMIVPSPPKVGPLRTSDQPVRDKNYFILFANPGRHIKKGNKVTVVVGEFRAENLTVE